MSAEIPTAEKTQEELCPDCGQRAAFVVKCRTGADSWVCETCFNVRWQYDHNKQAFWERSVAALLRHGLRTDETAQLADNICAEWEVRFGKGKI